MNNELNMFMNLMSQGNPNAVIENLINKNPQLIAILNQAKQSGMTMQEFTMQYAKQNGIDLNPMLEIMKHRGLKF